MKNFVLLLGLCLAFSLSAQTDGVGINTTDPKSTLDINGNLSVKVVSLTGNAGIGGTATPIIDGVYINLTPTAGNLEFILPDADEFPGRIYILRNISDTVNAEISSTDGSFFAGNSRVATAAPVVMTPDVAGDGDDPTKTLIFVSDGTNWTYGTLSF